MALACTTTQNKSLFFRVLDAYRGFLGVAKLFLANSLRKQADQSSVLLKLLWGLEAGVVGAFAGLSRSLSPDRASAIGSWMMRMLGPRLDKTRLIRRNLELAFPEKSAPDIEALVRGVWENLGAVLAEYPHLGKICHDEAASRLEIIRKGDARVFREDGAPAIFVTAHLANWEIAAGAVVWQGIPLTGIYTPVQNPHIDRMLYRSREALRCGMVTREGAVRKLVKELRRGVSAGLIVDQRVEGGEPVAFFGRDMQTATTPAQLALRFNAELIPVQVQRREGARFRVIFHEPILADDPALDEREKLLQMTRKISELFETWIRERPHEWLCSKRRWQKDLYVSAKR